jgi:hypothetical protein
MCSFFARVLVYLVSWLSQSPDEIIDFEIEISISPGNSADPSTEPFKGYKNEKKLRSWPPSIDRT